MPIPWLGVLEAALGLVEMTHGRRTKKKDDEGRRDLVERALTPGHIEASLAGVVISALREVFDRDSRRLELEREQIEVERQRAERALRLELLRHAADREIGRLRLVAGAAIAGWLGSLLIVSRVLDGGVLPRVILGMGWTMLVAALASASAGQSRVTSVLADVSDANLRRDVVDSGAAGAAALWLVVAGLAFVCVAVLI